MILIQPAPPFAAGQSGQSGTKARGMAYERKVGQLLAAYAEELGWTFYNHPWLRYGVGVVQPDFLLESPSGCVIICEAKLTEVDCTTQLNKYKYALRDRPTIGIQIARRITNPPTMQSLDDAIDNGLMLLWV